MSVLKRLFARTQPTFQAIHRAIGPAARALLGEVDWHAPPWAKWTAAQIRPRAQATVARARQHPRQTAMATGATVFLLAAAYAGWR